MKDSPSSESKPNGFESMKMKERKQTEISQTKEVIATPVRFGGEKDMGVKKVKHMELNPIRPYPMNFEEKIRNLFDEMDHDNQSKISRENMRNYMSKAGIYLPDHEINDLMKRYDTSKSGYFDFEEFRNFMIEQEEHLYVAFKHMDSSNSGFLDFEEIKKAHEELGISISEDDVMDMLEHADKTNNMKISYDEWYDYMHKHQIAPPNTFDKSIPHLLGFWKSRARSILVDIEEDIEFEDDILTNKDTFTRWKYIVSGFLGASVSRTATAPLDRVRCLLQVQTQIQALKNEGGVISGIHSVREALKEMGKEGFKGYFKGNGVNILRIAPEIALRGAFHEQFKRIILFVDEKKDKTPELTFPQRFVSGVTAAVCAQTCVYPLDFIKARMITSNTKQSIFQVFKESIKNDGLFSVYRGLGASLLRIATDVSMYESLKKCHFIYHSHLDPSERLATIPELLGMATVAVSISQLITYPLLLVQTRMQVQGMLENKHLKHDHYTGLFSALKSIKAKEGFRGLYRGAHVNFIKTVPQISLTFMCYEFFKRKFGLLSAC